MNKAKGFQLGDLVWAKMRGHPTWPAMIVDPPHNVPPIASKKYVLFFGDGDSAWMAEKQFMPFEENYEKFSKIKKAKFQVALKAVEKFTTFFLKLEDSCKTKKANLEVRKKMLKRYSTVSRKEMEQISLMKRKIKKETDATIKEERLITYSHLGPRNGCVVKNDGLSNKVVKNEKNATTCENNSFEMNFESSEEHAALRNEDFLQDTNDGQYIQMQCDSSAVVHNIDSKVPAFSRPSTSRETFGIPNEDHVPTPRKPSVAEQEKDDLKCFLPAGDGPSTSKEMFGKAHNSAQRYFLERLDLCNTASNKKNLKASKLSDSVQGDTQNQKKIAPSIEKPKKSSKKPTLFDKDCKKNLKTSKLNDSLQQNRGKAVTSIEKLKKSSKKPTLINKDCNKNLKASKKRIQGNTQNRRKVISSSIQRPKKSTRSNLTNLRRDCNVRAAQDKSAEQKKDGNESRKGESKSANANSNEETPNRTNDPRHFVPIDASDVPPEIKNLVKARIQRTVPMNINFAGIFDLTSLFTGHIASEEAPSEIHIIPEITEATVIKAHELAKESKEDDIVHENLLEADDPLCYPTVLERIFKKKAGEVYSSDELWKGIKKPFRLKIGFIGIGSMGSSIVKALLLFGHYVTIWNRTPKKPKCDEAVKNGANWAVSPADVVLKSDVIFCCATDCDACYEIFYGENGILDGFNASIDKKSYVELSTIDPDLSIKFSKEIEKAGGRYLEAPIIGTSCYEERLLFLVCAGDEYVYRELLDCLCCTGARIYLVGNSVGDALKFKDVYMSIVTGIFLPLVESVNLLKAVGSDPHILLEVFDETPLNCPVIKNKLDNILDGKWNNGVSVNEALKSFRHLREYDPNHQYRIIAAAHESLQLAKKQGFGHQDITSVFKLL